MILKIARTIVMIVIVQHFRCDFSYLLKSSKWRQRCKDNIYVSPSLHTRLSHPSVVITQSVLKLSSLKSEISDIDIILAFDKLMKESKLWSWFETRHSLWLGFLDCCLILSESFVSQLFPVWGSVSNRQQLGTNMGTTSPKDIGQYICSCIFETL